MFRELRNLVQLVGTIAVLVALYPYLQQTDSPFHLVYCLVFVVCLAGSAGSMGRRRAYDGGYDGHHHHHHRESDRGGSFMAGVMLILGMAVGVAFLRHAGHFRHHRGPGERHYPYQGGAR